MGFEFGRWIRPTTIQAAFGHPACQIPNLGIEPPEWRESGRPPSASPAPPSIRGLSLTGPSLIRASAERILNHEFDLPRSTLYRDVLTASAEGVGSQEFQIGHAGIGVRFKGLYRP